MVDLLGSVRLHQRRRGVYGYIFLLDSVVFTPKGLFRVHVLMPNQCIAFLFLMTPTKPNGSILIYEKLIRPYVLKHEKKLDQAFDAATDLAGDFANTGGFSVLNGSLFVTVQANCR